MKAVWKDTVLAESSETIVVEGNHYFPPESIKSEYFHKNDMHTTCPWKGTASYFDIVVRDEKNPGGAWYYPRSSSAARQIEGYIAFWRGVRVEP